MSHARAAIAGVLAVGVVLLLTTEGPLRDPDRALVAFGGLLVILGLLVGADIVAAVRGRSDEEGE